MHFLKISICVFKNLYNIQNHNDTIVELKELMNSARREALNK